MMKQLIRVCLLMVVIVQAARDSTAQQNDETPKDSSNHTTLILPFLTSAQETGLEYGMLGVYSFRLPGVGFQTRNSSVEQALSYSTKKQFRIATTANFWFKDNNWHLKGYFKYSNAPMFFFGTGNSTHELDGIELTDKKLVFTLDAQQKLFKNIYAGLGLGFRKEIFSTKTTGNIYDKSELTGKSGGHTTYLNLMAVYDSRDKVNYTHAGSYASIGNQLSFKSALSDFSFVLIDIDLRHFYLLHQTLTLAGNLLINSLQGADLAFFMLPMLGGDTMMRAYYLGRFRAQNQIAMQAELRYRPFALRADAGLFSLSRVAMVLFGGTGKVFANDEYTMTHLKPSYGLGIRYIFDPKDRLSIRIDYGWGEKLPGEKQQQGVYFSFNEAF